MRQCRASRAQQRVWLRSAIWKRRLPQRSKGKSSPVHRADPQSWGESRRARFSGSHRAPWARTCGQPARGDDAGGSVAARGTCDDHLALRDVAGALTVPELANTLATTARALHRDFAIAKPRLWVAGLAPTLAREVTLATKRSASSRQPSASPEPCCLSFRRCASRGLCPRQLVSCRDHRTAGAATRRGGGDVPRPGADPA